MICFLYLAIQLELIMVFKVVFTWSLCLITAETIDTSNDVIFITGGYPSSISGRSTEVLDLSSNCSKLTEDLPDNRSGHTMNILEDLSILLCGGVATANKCIRYSGMTSTISAIGRWTYHSTTVRRRREHSGVTVRGTTFLLGGYDPESVQSIESLERNSQTWIELFKPPYKIGEGSCMADLGDGTVIVTGGRYSMKKVSKMIVATGQWEVIGDMPRRMGHGCAVMGELLVVAGGRNEEQYLRSSAVLNLVTMDWSIAGEMENVRIATQLVVVNHRMIIVGGWTGIVYLDILEEMDMKTLQWKRLDVRMKKVRGGFSVVTVPWKIVYPGFH